MVQWSVLLHCRFLFIYPVMDSLGFLKLWFGDFISSGKILAIFSLAILFNFF